MQLFGSIIPIFSGQRHSEWNSRIVSRLWCSFWHWFFTTGAFITIAHENFETENNSSDEEYMLSDEDVEDTVMIDENGAIYVNSLTLVHFRSKLVLHLDILFKRKELLRPKRISAHRMLWLLVFMFLTN